MISFIITAREEPPERLRRTIHELRATSPERDREIIVIDDGSLEPIAGLPPDVHILRNAWAIGVSRARRQGASLSSGDALVCMDAHMTFGRSWLDRMLKHVESGALLCPPFYDYEREVCHCYGADFVWNSAREYERQLSPGLGLRHRIGHPGRGARDVPMVIGACYMFARSTYDALGGFSPLYRVWGTDEQDLSARAWLAGFGVKCVTNAQVGHYTRASFPYRVSFEDVEFNQLVMLRTIFEESTVAALEPRYQPLPAAVVDWVDEADVSGWRGIVQKSRMLRDEEFLRRFLPELSSTMNSA